MSADPVIYCLQELTDYRQFERLCSDLMDGCGYTSIDPLGGSSDGGRDALFYRAGEEPTVFAYTVRTDWRRKLLQDCSRIQEEGHKVSSLVYVCTSTLTTTEKDDIRAHVLATFGWDLQVYDLERIRVLLTGSLRHLIPRHPAIFCPPWFPEAGEAAGPGQKGLSNRSRIYVAASLAVLAVLGFLALWTQSHQHDKRLSAQIAELVARSRAPEQVRGSVDDLLRNQNIPREAIISSLVILGAKPDIPVDEIPSFFENFATAYLKSKSIDGSSYLSDEARETGRRARQNIDKGNLEGAEQALQTSVKTLEKHLERNQEDLVRMYEDLAYVLTMKAEYKEAGEVWMKAAMLVGRDSGKAVTLKMLAWQALGTHGTVFVDKAALRQVINQAKPLAAELESVGDLGGARWVRSLNVSAMRRLAMLESDNAMLEEAEASFDEVVKGCDERKPSIDCYLAFSSFSELFRDRGSRTLLTEEGRSRQKSRLLRSLQAAKLAKAHADAVGNESSKVNADLQHALAEMLYADYLDDASLVAKGGKTVFEKFNELYAQISSGGHPEVLELAIGALMLHSDSFDARAVSRIAEAEKKSIEREPGGKSYVWADRQFRLGHILRVLWKKQNDVAKLEQGIRESEKAFEFIDEKLPLQLATKQIDFAILLSDYGRETRSVAYLERAALTFKTAADNLSRLDAIVDRAFALRNMSISLARLQEIGGKSCWKEVQQRVDTESSTIGEVVELGIDAVYGESGPSADKQSRYAEFMRRREELGEMRRSVDRHSGTCLPALPEAPSLRKIA